MRKIISAILLISLIVLFSGCDSKNNDIEKQSYEAKNTESDTDSNLETEISNPTQNNTINQSVDFSDCFNGVNGSAGKNQNDGISQLIFKMKINQLGGMRKK